MLKGSRIYPLPATLDFLPISLVTEETNKSKTILADTLNVKALTTHFCLCIYRKTRVNSVVLTPEKMRH